MNPTLHHSKRKRRVKRILVSAQALVDLLLELQQFPARITYITSYEQLPEDAKVIGVEISDRHLNTFAVYVESEEFDEIDEGLVTPDHAVYLSRYDSGIGQQAIPLAGEPPQPIPTDWQHFKVGAHRIKGGHPTERQYLRTYWNGTFEGEDYGDFELLPIDCSMNEVGQSCDRLREDAAGVLNELLKAAAVRRATSTLPR